MLVLPVAFWLANAAMTGWLANTKGRDGWSWFFLALLLGPIALVGVGFAPRGTSTRFWWCPACREAIARDADRCPFCGEDVSEPESTEENPYLR